MALLIVALLLFVASNAQKCKEQKRVCNRTPEECCSSYGWCGDTALYCDGTPLYEDATGDNTGEGTNEETNNEETNNEETNNEETNNEETNEEPGGDTDVVQPFRQHCNCICYGDPHCQMWNCGKNSWQGPHRSAALNVYYMTPCNGHTTDDMPFELIGVNQRYDSYFTAVDFTILKLYDDNDVYCIKNKGNQGVSYNNDCGDTYGTTPNQNEDISIGSNFVMTWKLENGYSKLYLTVNNMECEDYAVTVTTMTATDREESVSITVSDCYKRFTCGMCGDFYTTHPGFQQIDGTVTELDQGSWGGTANDETGLTYVVDDDEPTTQTPMRRLLQQSETQIAHVPCFGLREDIETQCNAQLRPYAECCWDRKAFCEGVIDSCSWDSCSCVMGKAATLAEAQDQNVVDLCVTNILNASMSFVCGLEKENFIHPDMSIYDRELAKSDGKSTESCKESDAGLNIFIGIVIGCIVCGIIGALVYCFVVKPKLAKQVSFGTTNVSDHDEATNNTQI